MPLVLAQRRLWGRPISTHGRLFCSKRPTEVCAARRGKSKAAFPDELVLAGEGCSPPVGWGGLSPVPAASFRLSPDPALASWDCLQRLKASNT